MGNTNTTTISTNTNNNEYDACLVCWEKIQKHNLVSCNKCNVQMHDFCYANYNKIKKYNFCICPHCQRVGTLKPKVWTTQCIFEKTCKNY